MKILEDIFGCLAIEFKDQNDKPRKYHLKYTLQSLKDLAVQGIDLNEQETFSDPEKIACVIHAGMIEEHKKLVSSKELIKMIPIDQVNQLIDSCIKIIKHSWIQDEGFDDASVNNGGEVSKKKLSSQT